MNLGNIPFLDPKICWLFHWMIEEQFNVSQVDSMLNYIQLSI